MKKLTLLSVILLMAAVICAQQIIVPADQPSIQAAIEAAIEGDTVLVEEGTYFENINFQGKAITVASRFILDGDTAHISKTIIDGSQPAHPDTASVVIMWSGEDTTSVLLGFTLTGGNGTFNKWDGDPNIIGGAVLMLSSGGKICFNIIEENHTNNHGYGYMIYGGTVFASVDKQHRAIIRNNVIRNNTTQANWFDGGCIFLNGGGILLESNQILNNSVTGVYGYGAGVAIFNYATNDVIEELIVRNNIISGNSGTSSGGTKCDGGGIFIAFAYENRGPEIYNNIITGNSVDGMGGGIGHWWDAAVVNNNTIFNNVAERGGNNLAPGEGTMILFNNILGADEGLSGEDIAYRTSIHGPLVAHHNVLKDPLITDLTITSVGNIVGNPVFETDSFALSALSPGIGWGLDSLKIDGISYYAPPTDFNGNPRPHSIDNRMDIGALESPHEGFVYVPDTSFLHALIEAGVDTNEDSLIAFAEAEDVVIIDVSGSYDNMGVIEDMTGIEAFGNLEELMCVYNNLSTLDLSENPKLSELNCIENQLTSINVTHNPLLESLELGMNQLSSLNLLRNTQLEYLDIRHNPLTGIDLQNNPNLYYLNLEQCVNLNSIDVSHNNLLFYLSIHETRISSIDLSQNPDLVYFSSYGNHLLTELDLSKNSGIANLHIGACSIETLDISNLRTLFDCPGLTCFPDGPMSELYISDMLTLTSICVWDKFPFSESADYLHNCPNAYFTECPTGSREGKMEDLSISPNPTDGIIRIESGIPDGFSFWIVSLNGQLIMQDEVHGSSCQIDLSILQKGIYFITIRSEEFITSRKIIKVE